MSALRPDADRARPADIRKSSGKAATPKEKGGEGAKRGSKRRADEDEEVTFPFHRCSFISPRCPELTSIVSQAGEGGEEGGCCGYVQALA